MVGSILLSRGFGAGKNLCDGRDEMVMLYVLESSLTELLSDPVGQVRSTIAMLRSESLSGLSDLGWVTDPLQNPHRFKDQLNWTRTHQ